MAKEQAKSTQLSAVQGIPAMAQCEYCQKKPSMGNQVEHRGKAKYLGGVGTKVTGITRREFKPNLQRVKITTPNGTTVSMQKVPQAAKGKPAPAKAGK
jgi:large subunit ribosomal protein L28